MKISGWFHKSMVAMIAGVGWMNMAIGEVHAQMGKVVVYVAGNNPVTLAVTKQVVTNPVVGLVNGQTSIITGYFDQSTANFVTRELQSRGLDAKQGYYTTTPSNTYQTTPVATPIVAPAENSNYLSSITSEANTNPLSPNISQYRYVTAVPVQSPDNSALTKVRRFIPNAFVSKSQVGDYVYAGGYDNRNAAESLSYFLRSQGINARVIYF